MHPLSLIPFAVLFLTALPAKAGLVFDPRAFGAKGDGQTKDTEAIQRAIEAAAKTTGGTVRLAGGSFLSGTILLKSGVTLRIERGATLLGSTSHADYRKNRWLALVEAKGQHDISITGGGVIDGQGAALAADVLRLVNEKLIADPLAGDRPAEVNRPQLIELVDCGRVNVTDVTLKNSACWTQTYLHCDAVVLDHVTVRSTAYWNNDGLDLVDCRRSRVTHCDIDSADDGLCLKSGDKGGCEDIQVSDCKIRSSASAFKFGTSSRSGFKHINVTRLSIYNTFRSAIALESVDGAVIEDIHISNVDARNTGGAIFIRLGHRNKEGPPGSIHNVTISDVNVEIPAGSPDAGYEHAGPASRGPAHNLFPSSIVGLPGHQVSGISLKNIHVTTAGGGQRSVAELPLSKLKSIPEREDRYPEFSMFGELPAWGFYLRHAAGISFENVTLQASAKDYRSAIVGDDVLGLMLDHVILGPAGEEPVIALKDVSDFTLTNSPPPAGAKEVVRQLKEN